MDVKTDMCRIPVTATYRIIDGDPVKVAAEYRDIPAKVVAQFLLRKFGVDAVFGEGAPVCDQ